MSKEPKVALIGCGAIGEKRLSAIRKTGLGKITGIYDPVTDRAEALAHEFGTSAALHPSQLLENADIGVIIVATPNAYLADFGKRAITHGKHVLIEKPGAISRVEIEELSRCVASSENKLHCKIGYNHRFHPAAKRLAEELASDRVGKIFWIRAAYGHGGRPGYEKEWRFEKQLSGGGEIIDQGVHLLDLIRWWTHEELELVFCSRQNLFYKSTEEDNGFAQLRSPSGVQVQLHCSATQWKNLFRVEVATSQCLFIWNGLGNANYGAEKLTLFRRNPQGGKPEEESLVPETLSDDSWAEEWRHFYECVVGKRTDLMSGVKESDWIFDILNQMYQGENIR